MKHWSPYSLYYKYKRKHSGAKIQNNQKLKTEQCITNTDEFRNCTEIDQSDFWRAKRSGKRLDKKDPVPGCLSDCNDIQRRIIIYCKIYNLIWKDVRHNDTSRKRLPLCIGGEVNLLYPDLDNSECSQDDLEFQQ